MKLLKAPYIRTGRKGTLETCTCSVPARCAYGNSVLALEITRTSFHTIALLTVRCQQRKRTGLITTTTCSLSSAVSSFRYSRVNSGLSLLLPRFVDCLKRRRRWGRCTSLLVSAVFSRQCFHLLRYTNDGSTLTKQTTAIAAAVRMSVGRLMKEKSLFVAFAEPRGRRKRR